MGFSPICDPMTFFQKPGSVTFVPLWSPNFMQSFRKIVRAVSEIFKDERAFGPIDRQGRLLRTPRVNPGPIYMHNERVYQILSTKQQCIIIHLMVC